MITSTSSKAGLKRGLAALGTTSLCVLGLSACLGGSGGPRWARFGLSGTVVHSLWTDPRGEILAGASSGLYRWSRNHWVDLLPHRDIWQVTSASGRFIVAADNIGTVDVSPDSGHSWRRHFLTPEGVYAVTLNPHDSRWILAGGGGGIYLSRNGGATWRKTAAVGSNAANDFAWSLKQPDRVYAATVAGGSGRRGPGVLVSVDGGVTWRVEGQGLPTAGVMSLLTTSNQVWAGTMGYGVWVYRSSVRGWRRLPSGMPSQDDHGSDLIIPPRTKSLYAGTIGFGVFRSEDAGRTWTADSTGLVSQDNSNLVLGLAYDVSRHSLLAATGDGVFRQQLGAGRH